MQTATRSEKFSPLSEAAALFNSHPKAAIGLESRCGGLHQVVWGTVLRTLGSSPSSVWLGDRKLSPFFPALTSHLGNGVTKVSFTGTSQEPHIKVRLYWHGIFKQI